ncbi:unnamed protein product [Bemisia tabaci]|uniref:Uncharacterized protein n=1 Tax=Bemisia tabaci TaxID=7038 RepID=A0A9N9ZXF6_BEMTA|nr:unnamed protein product [Bemisia tabaci]
MVDARARSMAWPRFETGHNLNISVAEALRIGASQYGRVQSVKLLPRIKEEDGGGGLCATVSFMDIKSAAKAHDTEHKLEDCLLTTEYHEPAAIPSSGQPPLPALPLYASSRFQHGVVSRSRLRRGTKSPDCRIQFENRLIIHLRTGCRIHRFSPCFRAVGLLFALALDSTQVSAVICLFSQFSVEATPLL